MRKSTYIKNEYAKINVYEKRARFFSRTRFSIELLFNT